MDTNKGDNTWRITKVGDDGWEKSSKSEIFRGSYKDVIEKFNPGSSGNIKIRPADQFIPKDIYHTNDIHYDSYEKKVLMPKATENSEKTLYYIYTENRIGIGIINNKINEAIKRGLNKIEIHNFNLIDNKEILEKYRYFFTKLGYDFYFDDDIYRNSGYVKIVW